MKGKSLTLIGTAITLAFSGNVAMAQSSDSHIYAPTEIKMSPEGMKILCKHFPLNSRCPGGIPLDRGFSTIPAQTPQTSISNTNLNPTIVPIVPVDSHPGNSTPVVTPVPLTPADPNINNSTLPPTTVPGNNSFVEFSR